MAVRQFLTRFITRHGSSRLFSPLMRGRAIIFAMHRLHDSKRGVAGHNPAFVRKALEYLRKKPFEILALTELVERLSSNGRPIDRAIVFTQDDGYLEQATIAGPIFAEFDCPVTTFLTTDFIDGKMWFWWDRIEYVFRHTRRRSLTIKFPNGPQTVRWDTDSGRLIAQKEVIEACKLLPHEEKGRTINLLAETADVAPPTAPPDEYRPLSWDQARSCEARGMTFGPHSVSHPVLARTTDAQSRDEIEGSWKRLCEETARPVPVFCYPNGGVGDYGIREYATLAELGLRSAVIGQPGYPQRRAFLDGIGGRFNLPRTLFPTSLAGLAQVVSGIERVRRSLGLLPPF